MSSANRLIFRRFAVAAEIFLLAAAYSLSGLLPAIFGGRPLLLIAAGLAVSAFEEVPAAVIFGAVCGLLTDIITSGAAGYYSIALTLCCFAAASILHSKFRANLCSAALLAFLSVALIVLARYCAFCFTIGLADAARLFAEKGISKIILTFLSFLVLYPLNLLITGKGGRR